MGAGSGFLRRSGSTCPVWEHLIGCARHSCRRRYRGGRQAGCERGIRIGSWHDLHAGSASCLRYTLRCLHPSKICRQWRYRRGNRRNIQPAYRIGFPSAQVLAANAAGRISFLPIVCVNRDSLTDLTQSSRISSPAPVTERSQVAHYSCARTSSVDSGSGGSGGACSGATLCSCARCLTCGPAACYVVMRHGGAGCIGMSGKRCALCGGACHHLRNAAQRHGGQHSRETRAQRIAGQGRIEADAQNNAVHLFCHADNANDQHHPRDNSCAAWRIGHGADQQLDKHQIEYHQRAHGRKHPEPAAKNLCGGFGAAHGKCQWRTISQHAEDDIPLCHFKKQFDGLPLDNYIDQNDHDPARIGQHIKGICAKRVKGNGIGDLEHIHDRRR